MVASVGAGLRLGRCRLGNQLSDPRGPGLYEATLEGAFGTERPVWIERLAGALAKDPTAITTFLEEGRRRTRLHHPVLLEAWELAQAEDGEPFLIVTDPRGPDLGKLLSAEGRGFPTALAIHVVLELCRALEPITEGDPRWCGRIEPGRIFVSSHGALRFTLGVPVSGPVDRHTFVAPELTRGAAPTAKSDVYALAVLLGVVSRGKAEAAPGPPSLAPLLGSALATDPKERPELRAFREHLEAALEALGATTDELAQQLRARASLLCPPTLDLEAPPGGERPIPSRPPPRKVEQAPQARARSGSGRAYWLELEGRPLGPFSGAQLFEQLQALTPLAFSETKVAAQPLRFLPTGRFLELLGEELPPAETALHHLAPAGRLAKDPLPAVLARLAKAKATGRLILVRHDLGRADRRELHLQGGELVYAGALPATLRLWECLLTERRFGGQDLSASIHGALKSGTPLTLTKGAARALQQARDLESRRLLRETLRWRTGDYGFDEEAAPREGRPTPVLRLLSRSLYRASTAAELRFRLHPHLDRPFQRSERFEVEVQALGLLPTEQERISSFGHGYTLTESLAQSGQLKDQRSALVLAVLFVELGLLVPVEERRAKSGRTPPPNLSTEPTPA